MEKNITADPVKINLTRAEVLSYAIIEVMDGHYGFENRIHKSLLLNNVNFKTGFKMGDRTFRKYMEYLQTHDEKCSMICTTNKNGGGYFIVSTLDQFRQATEFRVRQYVTMLINLKQQTTKFSQSVNGFEQLEFDFAHFFNIEEFINELNKADYEHRKSISNNTPA